MTSVAVIIPTGGDCPFRARALSHVVDWWASIGHPAQVDRCDGPWSKGAAVNGAILSSLADVVVVADADSITSPEAVGEAINGAVRHGWAYPHQLVHRLTREGAAAVYDGSEPAGQPLANNAKQVAMPGGGIVVATRDAWAAVQGFDPRFVGWGGEDQALGVALRVMVGKPPKPSARSILWHLWHPPAPDARRGSRATLRLLRRYQLSAHRPQRMAELIEEVRCLNADASSVTI